MILSRDRYRISLPLGLIPLSLAGDTPRFAIQTCLARPDYGPKGLEGDGLGFGIPGRLRFSTQQQVRLRLDRRSPLPDHRSRRPARCEPGLERLHHHEQHQVRAHLDILSATPVTVPFTAEAAEGPLR